MMTQKSANQMVSGVVQMPLETLNSLPSVQATPSYSPLAHHQCVEIVMEAAEKILLPNGYVFHDCYLGVKDTKDMEFARMFGALVYKHPEIEDIGLSVGVRNSIDKSMSAGMVIGGQVFVCSNMMFNGDICHMRRHSGDIYKEFRDKVRLAMLDATDLFQKLLQFRTTMSSRPLEKMAKARLTGELWYRGLITPTLATLILKEIDDPSNEEFAAATMWAYYNHVTQALKKLQPEKAMSVYTDIHHFFDANLASAN